jgi:hypothetical protein
MIKNTLNPEHSVTPEGLGETLDALEEPVPATLEGAPFDTQPSVLLGISEAPPRLTGNDKEFDQTNTNQPDNQSNQKKSKADPCAPQQARSIQLDYKPITPEAHALGEHLIQVVQQWEFENGKRTRKRRKSVQKQFETAVVRLAADLLANAQRDSCRWGYKSLSPRSYTGQKTPHRAYMAVHESFLALGYIEKKIGYREAVFNGAFLRSTRIRATPTYFEIALEFGLTPKNVLTHFQRELPRHPLVLKAISKSTGYGRKIHGQKIRFNHTTQTGDLEDDIRELNLYLDTFELAGGIHRGYRRIFNNGDCEGFDWNKGGRLYSQGEGSYQRLKEKERVAMTINGEPVVEIDIRASYLTILYALNNKLLSVDSDPYEIDGFPRAIIKAWITMTLGFDKFHVRWPTVLKTKLEEKGFVLKKEFSVRNVQGAVLAKHPILINWPETKTTWADLMFLESEAVMNTSLRLMHQQDVPCFSVHDSIIVPKSKQVIAQRVLQEEYAKVSSVYPVLTIAHPETQSKSA